MIRELSRVHFELSNYCNLACKFCYAAFSKTTMSTEDAKEILLKVKEADTELLVFGGGDPLLRHDLVELITYCNTISLPVSIDTNALRITEEVLDNLKGRVERIGVPLDGCCEETQYKIREKKGLFQNSLYAMEQISKKGIPLKVNTMVNQINKDEITQIGNIISKYNPARWCVHQFCPVERGAKNTDLFEIANEEYQRITAEVKQEFPRLSIKFPCKDENNFKYFVISPDGMLYTVMNNQNVYLENLVEMQRQAA